jgi:hypothetical protein
MSLLVMSMPAHGSSQMGADLICDGMGEWTSVFFDIGRQMEVFLTDGCIEMKLPLDSM